MKTIGYYFFKYWVLFGLWAYFKKLKVVGLDNIPHDKPVLFLSNHQSALMDVLLIATLCKRKPWYLTRADVFKSAVFRPLFRFLQMLPIYRIRDGKKSVFKNQAVFDECSQILMNNGCILLFPEANHNLERRVRPLSKGFTRILDNALDKDPNLDIQLVPVGQNYQNAVQTGDSAALYFGSPIAVNAFTPYEDRTVRLKMEVSKALKKLTTHIEPKEKYAEKLKKLHAVNADFTDPVKTNKLLETSTLLEDNGRGKSAFASLTRYLFYLINLPLVFLWRLFLKPRVPEPEFMATYRFGFGMLAYPIFYALLLFVMTKAFTLKTACLTIVLHAVLSIFLLKTMTVTSYGQRK